MAKQKRGNLSFILRTGANSQFGPAWPGIVEPEGPCRRTLTIPMGIPILEVEISGKKECHRDC